MTSRRKLKQLYYWTTLSLLIPLSQNTLELIKEEKNHSVYILKYWILYLWFKVTCLSIHIGQGVATKGTCLNINLGFLEEKIFFLEFHKVYNMALDTLITHTERFLCRSHKVVVSSVFPEYHYYIINKHFFI